MPSFKFIIKIPKKIIPEKIDFIPYSKKNRKIKKPKSK
jgi:hypothetical protein